MGRDAARAFVHGDDAARVQRHGDGPGGRLPGCVGSRGRARGLVHGLELRVGNLQAARSPELDLAEQHDVLVRPDHVFQEGLIGPHHLDLAARVLHERGEQAKVRPPGVLHMAVQHFAADGGHLPRFEADDGLETASVFVPHGKAEQQVLDRVQARLLQVRRLARADALQVLQRRLQDVLRHTAQE